MDIKDLKILNIHGSSGNGITQRSVSDVAASMGGLGSRGGGGGKTGGGPTNSTPMVVPSRAEQKAVEGHGSPQQPGAKSYGERHADAAGQTKGFRRRHNSCKYVTVMNTTHTLL